MVALSFTPSRTCRQFMLDDSFIRLIAGPVGSGKSTSCIWELFRRACEQAPGPDGIRRTRFAIVRQTLVQLKSTVLKDVLEIFGAVADYRVSESTVYIRFGDVDSEWWLVPLEKEDDARRLLSSQITGAWVNEAIEVDIALMAGLAGRCGRYPKPFATWRGLLLDTNMPTSGSSWHNAMVNPAPDWEIFTQPGGLSADAENLEWLLQNEQSIKLPVTDPSRRATGRIYYERLARSSNLDWVKRYVHAEYGSDPSGTAVYRLTFKRSFHVVDELEPVAGRLLIIGQDFGRDPCSVITQVDHFGRLLILEEVIAEDTGLEQHINIALRPALIQERYLGKPIAIVGDPSGGNRSSIYEINEFDFLQSAGFQAFKAPSNDPDTRIRAVEAWLMGARNGGAAVLIDATRCPTIVAGFDGGYRFGFTRAGQRKPSPDKNRYSHSADAVQYAAMASASGMHSMIGGRVMNGRRVPNVRPRPSAKGWT